MAEGVDLNRDLRVEIVCVLLYAAILIRMDKAAGFRLAASWYLRGSYVMRDISNWAATTAIRWENAAKELVAP
jgi:hypothetical protein